MIFSKKIKLQIPNPCSENWDAMKPIANGRYCASCSTNVLDFTNMSEKQLVDYFKSNKGNICGRFKSTQLNKTYEIQPPIQLSAQKRFFKYFISFLLSSKAFINKAIGQTDVVKMEQTDTSKIMQNDTSRASVQNDTITIDSCEIVDNDSLKLNEEFVWNEKTIARYIETITIDSFFMGDVITGYMPTPSPKSPYEEFIDFFKLNKKSAVSKSGSIEMAKNPKAPEKPIEKSTIKISAEAILPEEVRMKSEKRV